MNQFMSAALYDAPNQMKFVKDYPIAPVGDDEVLLRIESAGICGSDMHAYHGNDPRRQPGLILGHEFCASVMSGAHQGKLVTANPLITCGVCHYCQQGRDNLCNNRDMIGMNKAGAFAQFMTLPKRCLVFAPSNMTANHIALTEPAATVVHAVNLTAKSSQQSWSESRVLVIGAGAIGFLTALLLKSYGVRHMQILETNQNRHALIKAQLGINAIDPINETVACDAFDIVIDCVGSKQTRQSAFNAIAAGGVITHVGLQSWQSEIDMRKLTLQEITLLGCYTYTMQDFNDALKALNDGLFGDLDALLLEMPLSQAQKAFQQLDSGKIAATKVILKPNVI